jgi:hypothetical protein
MQTRAPATTLAREVRVPKPSIWLGNVAFVSTRKRKNFFFEKKKQKTFIRLASAFPERLGPGFKSFLVLFFKKELLS